MRLTGPVCLLGVLVLGAAAPDSSMIEWPFYGGDQATGARADGELVALALK